MFLRQDSMLPMLKTAPLHIEDRNFSDLELVINIADTMEQAYFDDGVEGLFRAQLQDGVLTMELTEIPAATFRIYAASDISKILVNGAEKAFHMEDGCFVI